MQKLLIYILLTLLTLSVYANNEVQSKQELPSCAVDSDKCKTCTYATESGSTSKTSTVVVLLVLLTGYLYLKHKKKYIIASGGLVLVLFFGASYWFAGAGKPEDCPESLDTTNVNVFVEPGDEFIKAESSSVLDEFNEPEENNASTEALDVEDEFAAGGDEFTSVDSDEFKSSDDEFSEAGDEFSSGTDEFSAGSEDEFGSTADEFSESIPATEEDAGLTQGQKDHLRDLLILFVLLVVIRIFKKYDTFRKLRPLFLLGTLVWLGFYHGGCPCMISSFQNLILWGFGSEVVWVSLIWFLALLPLTYFFGKIWCGWLCHLGGLQEFIFSSTQIQKLKTPKYQSLLHSIQIGVFVVLLVQIAFTHSNVFIHYDPFKVAFNLFSSNTTGYVLLVILLVSSLFVYRPFCRIFCPVGLVLTWVLALPGARRISQDENCVDCISCSKACKTNSINYANKKSEVKTIGCIACGDCIDSCHKDAIYFIGKNRTKKCS